MLAATFLSLLLAKSPQTSHNDLPSSRACQAGVSLTTEEKLKKLSFSQVNCINIVPQRPILTLTTTHSFLNIEPVRKIDQCSQIKPQTRDMNFQSIPLPRGEDLYLDQENEILNELINPFLDERLIEISNWRNATFERRTSEDIHKLGFVLEEDESGDESYDNLGYETLSEVSFPSLHDDDSDDDIDDVDDELIPGPSVPSSSSSESCRAYMSDGEGSVQAMASLEDLESLPDFEVYDDGVMADEEVEEEQQWEEEEQEFVVHQVHSVM